MPAPARKPEQKLWHIGSSDIYVEQQQNNKTTMKKNTLRHGLRGNQFATSFAALMDRAASADVIFAVDRNSGAEHLLYGRTTLDGIIKSGVGRKLAVGRMKIDSSSFELRQACALVMAAKGSCDLVI